MSSKNEKDLGGRPKTPKRKLRRHRENLLLDDTEKKVFDILVEQVSARENRPVHGSEIVRARMRPLLEQTAYENGIELNPSRGSDLQSTDLIE